MRLAVTAATDALREVIPLTAPADVALSRFFRAHPELGSRDRAFVAASVFGVLRHRASLAWLAPDAPLRRTVLAERMRHGGLSIRDLEPGTKPDDPEWLAALKGRSLDDAPLAVRTELPDWVLERILPSLGDAAVLALAGGLCRSAPLDLRVNTVRAERDAVLAQLRGEGLDAAATPYSPVGIRLGGHPPVNRHPLFLDGTIEVQDEGSQILGFLLAPKRRDTVVDFCAGAGGKTLLIGALMRSQGRLYAFDISDARLRKLGPRLARSGLSNVHPQRIESENDVRVTRIAGKVDRVLVDAPCSGLGTLRRNPDLKWRQSPAALAELVDRQTRILDAAATLPRPGGRLVYATCSILPEENDAIAEAFLARHPGFAEIDCSAALAAAGVALDTGPRLRLRPDIHGTDGFFAAAFERRSDAG
jgi:16S rRNA (cytosine967-C5)-methyltransferase